MKPNKRIYLDDFYQLHGRHLYADEWNDNAIYFLNSKSPTLIGFDLSSKEMDTLMSQGTHLNKMAVDNAKKAQVHFIKHLDKVFFNDNFREPYKYRGEVLDYIFIGSKCIDSQGKSHICQITLKPSSEFVDKKSIQFFDPNVSQTIRKNNKAILVSKAVLLHFDFFGIPANKKLLIAKIQDEYQAIYGEQVNENLVYDAIAVMADYWNERSQN